MRRVAVPTAALLVAASAGSAQEVVQEIRATTPPTLIDELSDRAQVSGARVVVGIMSEASAPLPAEPVLIARLPEWDKACARLISPNALYVGRAEYPVPLDRDGDDFILVFSINRGNTDKIQTADPGALAVAVSKGGCDERPEIFALAALRASESRQGLGGAAGAPLTVFVNGQGASRVAIQVAEAKPQACQPAGDAGGAGFNWLCQIRLPETPAGGEVMVSVFRRAYGSPAPPERIRIQLPSG